MACKPFMLTAAMLRNRLGLVNNLQ